MLKHKSRRDPFFNEAAGFKLDLSLSFAGPLVIGRLCIGFAESTEVTNVELDCIMQKYIPVN